MKDYGAREGALGISACEDDDDGVSVVVGDTNSKRWVGRYLPSARIPSGEWHIQNEIIHFEPVMISFCDVI